MYTAQGGHQQGALHPNNSNRIVIENQISMENREALAFLAEGSYLSVDLPED